MKYFLVPLLISLLLTSCMKKETIDLIVYNAKVYTVDSEFTVVDAIAVKNSKIYDRGSYEILKEKYKAKKSIDAKGNYIYPGFHDAHCHFYGYASVKKRYADLTGTKSFEEIITKLKEHESKFPDSKWILARGWDQNDWKFKEFPDNQILNKEFPAKNVLLIRVDGHAVIANNNVLDLAGFNLKTNIEGGDILIKNGRLTGIALDNAADSLKYFIPEMNKTEIEDALLSAQQDMFKCGLTSLTDAGLNYKIIEQIKSLSENDKIKLKLDLMISSDKETMDFYFSKGKYQNHKLRIASLKLYADGALGSRGACLLRPYNDDSLNYGFLIKPKDELTELVRKGFENHYQVNTHAIGDSAVRTMLEIYSEFLDKGNDKRWRIEHSQIVSDEDLKYFRDYKIIPAINTTHATSDMYWAEKRLGAERINTAYRYNELLQTNGFIPNGSDFPVESINPVLGFYAAVFRKDDKGFPEDGFLIKNSLSREEALKSMTIWAAKASFMDDFQGSIENGKYADFVITNTDLMEDNPEKILNTNILYTFTDGIIVYQKK